MTYKPDLIFVYGTLRRGESADLSYDDKAKFLFEDRVNGRLYNLGWYPGMKAIGTSIFDDALPQVHGHVFRILDASIIERLDAYEGYPHLYDRIVVGLASGEKAYVYTYNPPVDESAFLPSGDWCKPTNYLPYSG